MAEREISVICSLRKKEENLQCENYWGTALLNPECKILSSIINNKTKPFVKVIIGYQCGFMRNKSMTDQIFVIRQILKKTYNITTFIYLSTLRQRMTPLRGTNYTQL